MYIVLSHCINSIIYKMKFLSIVVVFVTVFSSLEGKPAAEQQTPNTGAINLGDFITQAQTNINDIAKQIQQQLDLPDQQTVINTIKAESSNFVNNVTEHVKSLSEEIKNKSPELEKVFNDVKTKVTKLFEDINAGIPNAQEQATALQAKFQEGVQVLIKETDRAAKAVTQNSDKVHDDIINWTKQAVDIAVQATKNLNQQLQQAASAKN